MDVLYSRMKKSKNRHTTYSDYMFIDILYVDKNANKSEVSSKKQKENNYNDKL